MNIFLKHSGKLHYKSHKDLPEIVLDSEATSSNNEVHVSFRKSNARAKVVADVTACRRFLDLPDADVFFYGLETDSPLAPLILWDCAHALPVGRTVTLRNETFQVDYLERSYFRESLAVEKKDNTTTVLRKIKKLPVEEQAGLDDWTFGIPVGPGDATLLNYVVKRILDLEIPHKEILLCGMPGENFRYFADVRIVGEDIPAPPVRISTKKNRLADEASYKNLCILHDRVYLPANFLEGVQAFGDFFPFVTLQSLYFVDKYNFIPRRYSDYGRFIRGYNTDFSIVSGDNSKNSVSKKFHKQTVSELERKFTACASCLRYSHNNYATGSLYISKTALFVDYRLDDALLWEEFEDVEFACRISSSGIPMRVNNELLTQSLIGRPLITTNGYVTVESTSGVVKAKRFVTELLPIAKKPLVKVSISEAVIKMQKFAHKYLHNDSHIDFALGGCFTLHQWLYAYVSLISKASFLNTHQNAREFVTDVEKLLVHDHSGAYNREEIAEKITREGTQGKMGLLARPHKIISYVCDMMFQKTMFYNSLDEFLPTPSFFLKVGSLLSAILLRCAQWDYVYTKPSIRAVYKIIIASTPFKEK